MLAPLLMWSWAPGDADAIKITLATQSGAFSWSGTFGPPAILSLTGPAAFIGGEQQKTLAAIERDVNAHGGVYGRKIVYKYINDGYDPTTTASVELSPTCTSAMGGVPVRTQ